MRVAVFDLETNGMTGSSVLSASSLVFDSHGALLGLFNRFYFPQERWDARTAQIHGLTPERLRALRAARPAPSYFLEDWPDLIDFWYERGVEGIVVHNLTFDTSFLPEIAQSAFPWWCSMRGLTDWCAIPHRPGNAGTAEKRYKWPKLREALDIFCNGPRSLPPPPRTSHIEEALGLARPHVSLWDCFELYRVVVRVALHRPDLLTFAPHVIPFQAPGKKRGRFSPSLFDPGDARFFPKSDPFTEALFACEQKLHSFCDPGG
ncbi:MAG: hypothetical protein LBR61_02825 [Synergistaceae bacterium]|jgi:hypothetical protein|nr:hypothetical protein [Synergistaceae bacterium]